MKVKKRDNWGSFEYYFGGAKIDARLNGKIELSNGTVCDYESRYHSERVSDWGRSYSVETRKLIALIPFNEQIIEAELEKLDISWITPIPNPETK